MDTCINESLNQWTFVCKVLLQLNPPHFTPLFSQSSHTDLPVICKKTQMLLSPGFAHAVFLLIRMLFPGLVLMAYSIIFFRSSLNVTSSVRPSLDNLSKLQTCSRLTPYLLACSVCSCSFITMECTAYLLTYVVHCVLAPTWMPAPEEWDFCLFPPLLSLQYQEWGLAE